MSEDSSTTSGPRGQQRLRPFQATRWIWLASGLTGTERSVLQVVMLHSDNFTCQTYVSEETIWKQAGCGVRTARRTLGALRQHGLISWERHRKPGGQWDGRQYTLSDELLARVGAFADTTGQTDRWQESPPAKSNRSHRPNRTTTTGQKDPLSAAQISADQKSTEGASAKANAAQGGDSGHKERRASEGAHALVVATYFEAFEARRGEKPAFGPAEGTAVKKLLVALGGDVERACAIVRNALSADRFGSDTVTIRQIGNNPSQYMGAAPAKKRAERIRQEDYTAADWDEWETAKRAMQRQTGSDS